MGAWLRGALVLLLLPAALAACRDTDPPAADGSRPPPPLDACVAALVADGRTPGCRGVRIRVPNPDFVPQGLALAEDRTAYVSGYDASAPRGEKVCQIARVDRTTGRLLVWLSRVEAVAPGRAAAACLHAGGLALDEHGLWVAGVGRLWLLDPDLGVADAVRRVWFVDLDMKASALAVGPRDLLIGTYRGEERSRVGRVRLSDLLAPGVTAVSPEPAGPQVVVPVRTGATVSRLQGMTVARGRTWLARSTTYCGELVAPGGRRVPFVPGAEGFELRSGDVWVVSESGAGPYQSLGEGRPDLPTLSRISLDRVLTDATADCW